MLGGGLVTVIGCNLLLPTSWSSFRAFADEAHQAEPWWTGDWGYRAPVRQPSDLAMRAVVADRGTIEPGTVLTDTSYMARGDFTRAGQKVTLRGDTFWLEQPGGELTLPPAVSLRRTEGAEVYRQAFRDAIAPFLGVVRTMDWCGPSSGLKTINDLRASGNSAHAIPLDVADEELSEEVGLLPRFTRALSDEVGPKMVWLTMPLLVALNVTEAARWVDAHRAPGQRTLIEVGNELWNNDERFVASAWARRWAERIYPNRHPILAVYHLVAQATLQLKNAFAGVDGIEFIICWQAANRWPILGDEWNSSERQRTTSSIGHVGVALYWGGETYAECQHSQDNALEDLDRWQVAILNLDHLPKLSLYEFGPDMPAQHSVTPAQMGTLEARFASELAKRPLTYACRYALAGQQWGLQPRLGEITPAYQALAAAAVGVPG